MMNNTPTTEERVWAVLSHLSALAFGMGILLPIIGWLEQRRKSKYTSFQCLQALGYQSLGYTIWLLSYLVVFIGILVLVVLLSFQTEQTDQRTGQITSLMFITVLGFFALYMLFPIVAAIACALGKEYRYPILGKQLAKYLGSPTSDEDANEQEERWVAAMGHFSVIIVLWGMLAPLTAWILQSKQNSFLRFQSIQTSIYQAFVNILYLGAGFVSFLGAMALFAMTGLEGDPNQASPVNFAGLGIFLVLLLIASIIVLIVPFFHILGQWAGYRVLKGDDYHYPIVGRLVERWMAKRPQPAVESGVPLKGETS